MTTTNTNTNQPGLLDRATSFFKGTSKKPTNTLSSSLEHLHTNQHAQADAEAQHQADLMSGLPSDMPSGTQSLSSETVPQPMPREVLNDVLSAHGHVPHAHHVDVEKVEQRHEQAVGPLGHVQQTSLLDKAKHAIDSLTGKTTTTQHPIQHHPGIPHSVLPDATLKQVQVAQGHPPHANHVDIDRVEQRHEQAVGPLGHVQPEPTVLDKVTQKIQDLVPPATFHSTSTSTVQTHPNIPHAAVPDEVLLDVQSQHGKVPHAQHVDVGKVEQRHEQAVGPLGQVQKEPGLLERMGHKISELVPSLAPVTTKSTSYVTIHTHPSIPHSALSNNVLRDIQLQHGKVPHAHHVDITQVERKHEQTLPLGHVHDITLLHKAKYAIDSLTGKTVAPLQHRPIQRHHNIPHSVLPDAILLQIQAAHGHPPHAKHVDIGLVEQRQEQRMIQAIGPLGRVLPGPTLLEKASQKIQRLTEPLATSLAAATTTHPPVIEQHPNVPHAAVPDQVLQDVQTQKGKVPHAHHVDIKQVEKQHEQAVGPLGHVQPEPTILDKMAHKLQDIMNRPTTTTTTTTTSSLDAHPNIPHAAVPDQVLKDVQSQKGKVPHAHHVDLAPVEQRHEHAVGPLGHVQKEPTLMDKVKNAIGLGDTTTSKPSTKSTTLADQHPNIPHAAVPDEVLKDVQSQKGKVPHAHHVDIDKVEQRHEQAVGPLGHVQKEPTLMDKTKYALGINKDEPTNINKNEPTTTFINVPQTTGSTLPATSSSLPATSSSLPGTTTLPPNDQSAMPIQQSSVAPVQPTLLDKVEYASFGVVPTKAAPTTTTTQAADVEHQKGKVPAHPMGHVQKEPTLMDKAKHAVGLGDTTTTTTSKPTTTSSKTLPADQHPNIPHAAVPDQVLKDVEHQKGKVPHAHHVDINKVEQRHEQAVGPLGHVQKEPTLMDKAKHAIGLGDTTTTTSKPTTTSSADQHPNIPHAAVPDQVLKDVQHQKGKVPHAHHVDINQVEQRHEQAVGPLGHVQKEPTLMDKTKHALGMDKDKTTTTNKDQIPSTTTINKDEPTTKDLHLKNVPDAKFINVPQTTASSTTLPATSSSLAGSSLTGATLPAIASALPGTTTLPLNDQGVKPIQQPVTTTAPTVVPVQPTILDKMEYKLFGVVPTKAAPTTTTTTTATDTKKPTSTTATDEHANIPHAAVPDQVLKDVQHQKGKVPHAHHVDINKVEQHHEQAVGPLGHVQKEPTFMDKAKHALGLDKDKTTTTTETRPNIMHNSLPTRVMNELKDQRGKVPHAKHVDINEVENERDRRLSQYGLIGRVVDPSKRPNIMHSSLPTRTLNEIESSQGQVPHAHHIDTQQLERERQRNLSQNKDIGRVMEPSSTTGPNIMHNSLPTRVMQDVKNAHGQVPHAHHVDINDIEKQREKRLSDSHMMGRIPERSNSGYTAGGFPESNEHITSSAPAPTAYFKNTNTADLPASSLTSDIGNKTGITTSSKSTTTPLVATLPPGSNLESASGVKFQPSDTTSHIKQPTFHPQQ